MIGPFDTFRRAIHLAVGLDASLLRVVALSLEISLGASAAASLLGLPLGGALAVLRFPGRRGLVLLANALLGLPPVVVGLVLYLLLSRAGPLGTMGLLFTPAAMVLAQFVLALPIVVALAHRAADGIWSIYADDLLVDGASLRCVIMTVLTIGRIEMLTAALAGFGRTISEVGAIMIVGGNIDGYTRTMTTSIVLETSRGNFAFALALGGVLVITSVIVSAMAFALARCGDCSTRGSTRLFRGAAMTRPSSRRSWVAALIGLLCATTVPSAHALAEVPFITVASTTSTEQSGLFGYLLPAFTKATGIEVRVVAVGTGQALKLGERGDADVLLVHDRNAELKFVSDGWGVGRHDLMYNDFIVVGPKADPAGVAGGNDVVAAFRKVAAAKAPFISRGDDSGTNAAELRFWRDTGIDPKAASNGAGWYNDIGGSMGAALNASAAMDAYTLTDRGTWINFNNRRNLVIVVENDRRLFNQYGVMLVNPARHPSVKAEIGQTFINWLVSPVGQQAIAGYRINGEQLFFPDVERPGL